MQYGLLFFFFKQKTAYEMRISDWSSDVCSSDLPIGDAYEAEESGAVAAVAEDILDSPTAPLALDLAPARAAGMLYPIEIARIAFRTRGIGSAARPPGAVAYADPVDADALAAQRPPALDKIGRASCRERVGQYV